MWNRTKNDDDRDDQIVMMIVFIIDLSSCVVLQINKNEVHTKVFSRCRRCCLSSRAGHRRCRAFSVNKVSIVAHLHSGGGIAAITFELWLVWGWEIQSRPTKNMRKKLTVWQAPLSWGRQVIDNTHLTLRNPSVAVLAVGRDVIAGGEKETDKPGVYFIPCIIFLTNPTHLSGFFSPK